MPGDQSYVPTRDGKSNHTSGNVSGEKHKEDNEHEPNDHKQFFDGNKSGDVSLSLDLLSWKVRLLEFGFAGQGKSAADCLNSGLLTRANSPPACNWIEK